MQGTTLPAIGSQASRLRAPIGDTDKFSSIDNIVGATPHLDGIRYIRSDSKRSKDYIPDASGTRSPKLGRSELKESSPKSGKWRTVLKPLRRRDLSSLRRSDGPDSSDTRVSHLELQGKYDRVVRKLEVAAMDIDILQSILVHIGHDAVRMDGKELLKCVEDSSSDTTLTPQPPRSAPEGRKRTPFVAPTDQRTPHLRLGPDDRIKSSKSDEEDSIGQTFVLDSLLPSECDAVQGLKPRKGLYEREAARMICEYVGYLKRANSAEMVQVKSESSKLVEVLKKQLEGQMTLNKDLVDKLKEMHEEIRNLEMELSVAPTRSMIRRAAEILDTQDATDKLDDVHGKEIMGVCTCGAFPSNQLFDEWGNEIRHNRAMPEQTRTAADIKAEERRRQVQKLLKEAELQREEILTGLKQTLNAMERSMNQREKAMESVAKDTMRVIANLGDTTLQNAKSNAGKIKNEAQEKADEIIKAAQKRANEIEKPPEDPEAKPEPEPEPEDATKNIGTNLIGQIFDGNVALPDTRTLEEAVELKKREKGGGNGPSGWGNGGPRRPVTLLEVLHRSKGCNTPHYDDPNWDPRNECEGMLHERLLKVNENIRALNYFGLDAHRVPTPPEASDRCEYCGAYSCNDHRKFTEKLDEFDKYIESIKEDRAALEFRLKGEANRMVSRAAKELEAMRTEKARATIDAAKFRVNFEFEQEKSEDLKKIIREKDSEIQGLHEEMEKIRAEVRDMQGRKRRLETILTQHKAEIKVLHDDVGRKAHRIRRMTERLVHDLHVPEPDDEEKEFFGRWPSGLELKALQKFLPDHLQKMRREKFERELQEIWEAASTESDMHLDRFYGPWEAEVERLRGRRDAAVEADIWSDVEDSASECDESIFSDPGENEEALVEPNTEVYTADDTVANLGDNPEIAVEPSPSSSPKPSTPTRPTLTKQPSSLSVRTTGQSSRTAGRSSRSLKHSNSYRRSKHLSQRKRRKLVDAGVDTEFLLEFEHVATDTTDLLPPDVEEMETHVFGSDAAGQDAKSSGCEAADCEVVTPLPMSPVQGLPRTPNPFKDERPFLAEVHVPTRPHSAPPYRQGENPEGEAVYVAAAEAVAAAAEIARELYVEKYDVGVGTSDDNPGTPSSLLPTSRIRSESDHKTRIPTPSSIEIISTMSHGTPEAAMEGEEGMSGSRPVTSQEVDRGEVCSASTDSTAASLIGTSQPAHAHPAQPLRMHRDSIDATRKLSVGSATSRRASLLRAAGAIGGLSSRRSSLSQPPNEQSRSPSPDFLRSDRSNISPVRVPAEVACPSCAHRFITIQSTGNEGASGVIEPRSNGASIGVALSAPATPRGTSVRSLSRSSLSHELNAAMNSSAFNIVKRRHRSSLLLNNMPMEHSQTPPSPSGSERIDTATPSSHRQSILSLSSHARTSSLAGSTSVDAARAAALVDHEPSNGGATPADAVVSKAPGSVAGSAADSTGTKALLGVPSPSVRSPAQHGRIAPLGAKARSSTTSMSSGALIQGTRLAALEENNVVVDPSADEPEPELELIEVLESATQTPPEWMLMPVESVMVQPTYPVAQSKRVQFGDRAVARLMDSIHMSEPPPPYQEYVHPEDSGVGGQSAYPTTATTHSPEVPKTLGQGRISPPPALRSSAPPRANKASASPSPQPVKGILRSPLIRPAGRIVPYDGPTETVCGDAGSEDLLQQTFGIAPDEVASWKWLTELKHPQRAGRHSPGSDDSGEGGGSGGDGHGEGASDAALDGESDGGGGEMVSKASPAVPTLTPQELGLPSLSRVWDVGMATVTKMPIDMEAKNALTSEAARLRAQWMGLVNMDRRRTLGADEDLSASEVVTPAPEDAPGSEEGGEEGGGSAGFRAFSKLISAVFEARLAADAEREEELDYGTWRDGGASDVLLAHFSDFVCQYFSRRYGLKSLVAPHVRSFHDHLKLYMSHAKVHVTAMLCSFNTPPIISRRFIHLYALLRRETLVSVSQARRARVDDSSAPPTSTLSGRGVGAEGPSSGIASATVSDPLTRAVHGHGPSFAQQRSPRKQGTLNPLAPSGFSGPKKSTVTDTGTGSVAHRVSLRMSVRDGLPPKEDALGRWWIPFERVQWLLSVMRVWLADTPSLAASLFHEIDLLWEPAKGPSWAMCPEEGMVDANEVLRLCLYTLMVHHDRLQASFTKVFQEACRTTDTDEPALDKSSVRWGFREFAGFLRWCDPDIPRSQYTTLFDRVRGFTDGSRASHISLSGFLRALTTPTSPLPPTVRFATCYDCSLLPKKDKQELLDRILTGNHAMFLRNSLGYLQDRVRKSIAATLKWTLEVRRRRSSDYLDESLIAIRQAVISAYVGLPNDVMRPSISLAAMWGDDIRISELVGTKIEAVSYNELRPLDSTDLAGADRNYHRGKSRGQPASKVSAGGRGGQGRLGPRTFVMPNMG
eukprot:Rmarinus@m.18327